MVQSTTTQKSPDKAVKSTDLLSLLAGVGFSLFWAMVIELVFYSGRQFAGQLAAGQLADFSSLESIAAVFCLFLGFGLVQLFSYSRFIERPIEIKLLLQIALFTFLLTLPFIACATLGVFLIHPPVALIFLAWLCLGIAAGLLLPAWGTVWSQLDAVRPDSHATSLHVSFAVAGSAILCGLLLFMPLNAHPVAVLLFYLGSTGLLLFCANQLPHSEFIDIKTSLKRLSLFSRMLFSPFLMGLGFGITLGVALLFVASTTGLLMAVVGIALASITMIAVLVLVRHVPRHSTFERCVFPLMAILLVALLLFEPLQARLILLTLLIADLSFALISHWNILAALSYRHHVHVVFHYAQGLIAPVCGVAVGTGICGVAVFFGVARDDLLFVSSLGLLLLLTLIPALIPYASNKTVEAVFAEDHSDEISGSWRLRCQSVSAEYALSPREIEVFQLLAKGRNAEYISKTLVVSVHTSKTHISRIYRKLNINSQQELINLVDSR
jgi:DNA-binding CsgD family transcriptional regulator